MGFSMVLLRGPHHASLRVTMVMSGSSMARTNDCLMWGMGCPGTSSNLNFWSSKQVVRVTSSVANVFPKHALGPAWKDRNLNGLSGLNLPNDDFPGMVSSSASSPLPLLLPQPLSSL